MFLLTPKIKRFNPCQPTIEQYKTITLISISKSKSLSRYTISTINDYKQNIFKSMLMIYQLHILIEIIWSNISLVVTYMLFWIRVWSLKPHITSGVLKLGYDCVEREYDLNLTFLCFYQAPKIHFLTLTGQKWTL